MIIYERDKNSLRKVSPKHSRKIPRIKFRLPLKIVALAVIIGGTIFGVVIVIQRLSLEAPTETVINNVELTEFKNVFLVANDEQTGNGASASLVAPKSWQRQRAKFDTTDLLNPSDYGILQINFSNSGDGDSSKRQGRIVIENISSWLAQDETNPGVAFGGLVSKEDKQKVFMSLTNLRQTKSVAQLQWNKIFTSKTEVGGVQKPTYVNTADGKLGGIIYGTIVTTDSSYKPHIVAYLTGTIANQPVLLRAEFAVVDQTYRELYGSISSSPEVAQQAIDEYKSGELNNENSTMLEHVAKVLKSFTLDTATRQ